MKKLTPIITTLFLLLFTAQAHAATATPSPATEDKSVISDKLNAEINNLKEKIASRVSELNLVEKRGIIGTVVAVSGNQITITDPSGKQRFVDVDEITKFASPASKTFGISDLTKGTKISTLGLYNKQSKRLLARFVNTSAEPVYLSGTIGSVDTKNFQLVVATTDKKETKVDNQNTTKISSYDGGFTKLGFSKLVTGDRVFVIGYPDKTDKTMIVADRIVVIPSLSQGGNTADQPATSATKPTVAPANR